MIVEIIPLGGIGNGAPLKLEASQIVIYQDNGTPIVVAAHYGAAGTIAVASVEHNQLEFNQMLRRLGIQMTVIVDRLHMPSPPPGARLVAGR